MDDISSLKTVYRKIPFTSLNLMYVCIYKIQGWAAGFNTGYGEKLSHTQTTPARQSGWLLLSFSPFPVFNPPAPLCIVLRNSETACKVGIARNNAFSLSNGPLCRLPLSNGN